jgi:deoxycytidine triphosphate deaminase
MVVHQSGILVSDDIVQTCNERRLIIEPFRQSHLQPTSYDISVNQVLSDDNELRDFEEVNIGHLQFMNLISEERFEFPLDMIGHIYFRSTYARKGLGTIHLGRIEAGWKGRLVIEILNARSTMTIRKGERIATVEFVSLPKAASSPYQGQFQGFGE